MLFSGQQPHLILPGLSHAFLISRALRNSRYFDITPPNLESIIYEEASHICAADVQAFAAHCHYPVSGKEYKPYQTITG